MERFETVLLRTNPDVRFDYVVKDILRDKASGWSHNYYSNDTTIWKKGLATHNQEIYKIDILIKRNKAAIEAYEKKITNSKLPTTHPDYKALEKGEMEEIDASFVKLAKENIHLADEMNKQQDEVTKYFQLDYIARSLYTNIYCLRNQYQLDGDLDRLRKGITLAYTMYYQSMGQPLPEVLPQSASVSATTTAW